MADRLKGYKWQVSRRDTSGRYVGGIIVTGRSEAY